MKQRRRATGIYYKFCRSVENIRVTLPGVPMKKCIRQQGGSPRKRSIIIKYSDSLCPRYGNDHFKIA